MLRSFSKRMGYLHDDDNAAALVSKWFDKDGLLEPLGNLNELGTALLVNIAPINPEATLTFIEQAAVRHSWFFGSQNTSRAQIVNILRSIAYDPALSDARLHCSRNLRPAEMTNANPQQTFLNLYFLFFSREPMLPLHSERPP